MAFLGKFKGGYQDLWKAIIRPPRDEYDVKDLGLLLFTLNPLTLSLGPQEFRLKGKVYTSDLTFKSRTKGT